MKYMPLLVLFAIIRNASKIKLCKDDKLWINRHGHLVTIECIDTIGMTTINDVSMIIIIGGAVVRNG